MVRMVIGGSLVAEAVLVWVGTGLADDALRRAEVHETAIEVMMWVRKGAEGHTRVASDDG